MAMAAAPGSSKCLLVTGPPVTQQMSPGHQIFHLSLMVAVILGRREDDLDHEGS